MVFYTYTLWVHAKQTAYHMRFMSVHGHTYLLAYNRGVQMEKLGLRPLTSRIS